ncbi:hypothetical protein AcV5_004771 [Taiwanofungus camphoratus]|nr:hypothetical protein AcV5_004771 [Antrodia cinnamomea]
MNLSQQQNTPPTSNQSNRQSRSTSGIIDPGNPVKVLESKGITEENKFDIAKLADVLLSYGDFKRVSNATPYIKKEEVNQIKAVATLLQEIARTQTPTEDDAHITKATLNKALADLKDSLISSLSNNTNTNDSYNSLPNRSNTYANAVRISLASKEALQKKQATS